MAPHLRVLVGGAYAGDAALRPQVLLDGEAVHLLLEFRRVLVPEYADADGGFVALLGWLSLVTRDDRQLKISGVFSFLLVRNRDLAVVPLSEATLTKDRTTMFRQMVVQYVMPLRPSHSTLVVLHTNGHIMHLI
jgi:hypothetical protein